MLSLALLLTALAQAHAQTSNNVNDRSFEPQDYAYSYLSGIFFVLSAGLFLCAVLVRCCCNYQRSAEKSKRGYREFVEDKLVKDTVDEIVGAQERKMDKAL